MRAIIDLAAIGGGLQLVGESRRPFLPREMPLLGKYHGEGEGLRFPRLCEHSAFTVAGSRQYDTLGLLGQIRDRFKISSNRSKYTESWGAAFAHPKLRARQNARNKCAAAFALAIYAGVWEDETQ